MNKKPIKLNRAEFHFPEGGIIDKLIPPEKEIPEEFFNNNNKWHRIATDWAFYGYKNLNVTPKKGIDAETALTNIIAVLKCWMEFNYKIAGCAFLMNEYFEDIKYNRKINYFG